MSSKPNARSASCHKSKEEKLQKIEAIREYKRRILSKRPVYKPNAGQKEVHLDQRPIRMVAAGNGCWAAGTKVRMFDGKTKNVEDVNVGDELMGPDGTKRTVLRLSAGEEMMYKITPKYSEPYVVNESHKLSIYRNAPGYHNTKEKQYLEPSVKEWLEWSDHDKRVSYQWRPETGVEYPAKPVLLDPYLLGTRLGDVASSSSKITTTDNKHIPEAYKINSKQTRLQLLAGLIDTGGHLSEGRYYEITQKRKQLAKDIRELADSLGFKTSFKTKTVNNTTYYRVSIIGPVEHIPVKLPHKKLQNLQRQRTHYLERFFIEPVGKGQFYGFQVDKDNLLLLSNYTVQRNSGKTASAVQEAIWWSTGYNPITKTYTRVPATIVILLDSPNKIDELWLPELNKWFDVENNCEMFKHGKPYITEIRFKNGSQIRFYFHNQEQMVFEGIMLDYLIADEPFPRYCWTGLARGARKKGTKPRFLLIGTPLGQPWMYEELWKPAEEGTREDIGLHRFSTTVNAHNLADGYIEQYSRNLSEKEKQIRLHGEFSHLGGLALAHLFSKNTHVIEGFPWPSGWPCVIAVDPHPAKNHVAILLGAGRDGHFYYIKELSSNSPPRQFAAELRQFTQGHRVVDTVVDSLGETPMSGGEGNKSFSDVLRDCGIRCRATQFKEKSDADFIQRIRQVLEVPKTPNNLGDTRPKLLIFQNNYGIIRDIENVQWLKYRGTQDSFKEKLDISNKDYLACLKYALATPIEAMGRTGRAPEIQRIGRSPWGRNTGRR